MLTRKANTDWHQAITWLRVDSLANLNHETLIVNKDYVAKPAMSLGF